jgi:hypothetical protein
LRHEKIFAAILTALLLPQTALADWRFVSEDGFSKIYLDPASRKNLPDGVVAVKALTDYRPQSPEAAAFKLSEKGLSEIETVLLNCGKKLYRSEGGNWFSGQMATGATQKAYPGKENWSATPAFYQGLFAEVCRRDE